MGSSRRYDGAEEARTRGFATPAFAGCAFSYVVVARVTIRRGTDLVNMGDATCPAGPAGVYSPSEAVIIGLRIESVVAVARRSKLLASGGNGLS